MHCFIYDWTKNIYPWVAILSFNYRVKQSHTSSSQSFHKCHISCPWYGQWSLSIVTIIPYPFFVVIYKLAPWSVLNSYRAISIITKTFFLYSSKITNESHCSMVIVNYIMVLRKRFSTVVLKGFLTEVVVIYAHLSHTFLVYLDSNTILLGYPAKIHVFNLTLTTLLSLHLIVT